MRNEVNEFLKSMVPAPARQALRRIENEAARVRYYGWRYQCPLCGGHVRKFLPSGLKIPVLAEKKVVGGGYRLNARCPICASSDRERLVYLYLSRKTDIFHAKARLLHVAPEYALTRMLKRYSNIDYVTADLNAKNVMVTMDITHIDEPDGSFDAVLCNHVLEHIVDDGAAMRELHRILRPGGWGILQVPLSLSLGQTYEDDSVTTASERERAFGQSDHVRIYAMDYVDRLEEAGFQVTLFQWWDHAEEFGGPKNRFGLIGNERIVTVRKSA